MLAYLLHFCKNYSPLHTRYCGLIFGAHTKGYYWAVLASNYYFM